MGILDLFDSPDLLGQLLGVSSANAAGAPPQQPPPSPPPNVMANAPATFAPGSTIDGGGLGGNFADRYSASSPAPPLSFADRAAPVSGAIANGTFDPQGANYTAFAPPAPGGTQVAAAPGGMTRGLSNATPPAPPPLPPPTSAPPSPPPGAMSPAQAPPTGVTPGGLEASLGLKPPQPPRGRSPQMAAIGDALYGFGRGLTAVGQTRPGATGAQAFAAGAGGALTGGADHARQAQNDFVNNTSKAFNEWIAAEKLGDEKTISQARSNYYNSLAQMRANGVKGSGAWQGSEYGKARELETMLDRWENNQRLQLQAKWKATFATPREIKTDLADLAKKKDDERTRRSKALGISPTEYRRGTAKEDAFDYEGMSRDQYLSVPDGAWIRKKDPKNPQADKDGYVYGHRDWLKTPPYEGWQPSQPAQPQPRAAPSPSDVEAMDQSVLGG